MLTKKEFLLILFSLFSWFFGETLGVFAIVGGCFLIFGIFLRTRSQTLKEYLLGNFFIYFGYSFLNQLPHFGVLVMLIIYFFVYKDRKALYDKFLKKEFYLNKNLVSIFLFLLYVSFLLLRGKGIGVRIF